MLGQLKTFVTAKLFSLFVTIAPVLLWLQNQVDHSPWFCGFVFFLHLLHIWLPVVFVAILLFSFLSFALKLLSWYGWLKKDQAADSPLISGLEFSLHLLHIWFPVVFWASFLFSFLHFARSWLRKG